MPHRSEPDTKAENPAQKLVLPPLIMLRAFEATARLGTMRGAAADLGISHTVISRHIGNLQAWLGVKLLLSGPRGVNLTREGELYARRLQAAFSIISEATTELKPQAPTASLRIWCMAGLATYWLMPRLPAIEKMLPNVEIVVRPFQRAPGFDPGHADVVIGYAPSDQLPPDASPLTCPFMFPVASPEWVEAHPQVKSAGDLATASLIHEESREQWSDWFDRAGIHPCPTLRGPLLWDAGLTIDAAVRGQGVALAPRLVSDQLVKEGRLVELFDTAVQQGDYYLIASRKQSRSKAVRLLSAWLQTELSSEDRQSTMSANNGKSASAPV